jgi:uracil-DNA glycosylase
MANVPPRGNVQSGFNRGSIGHHPWPSLHPPRRDATRRQLPRRAHPPTLRSMGIANDSLKDMDWHAAMAALAWQVDMGVHEAICDDPINRYDLPDTLAPVARPSAPPKAAEPVAAFTPQARVLDIPALAQTAANRATDLSSLRAEMEAFDHCDLKKGARNLVFSDGNPAAPVMIVGEAPGRDEDYAGKPFVGRAGQLLDRMLAAIGLSRGAEDAQSAFYITNVMPWRPPANRDPTPEEIAMMQPFLRKHIDLVNPQILIAMGNTSCMALLGERGILRLRGQWADVNGRPAMPMTHPAYLLRNPAAKKEAWADLIAIKSRLISAAP